MDNIEAHAQRFGQVAIKALAPVVVPLAGVVLCAVVVGAGILSVGIFIGRSFSGRVSEGPGRE